MFFNVYFVFWLLVEILELFCISFNILFVLKKVSIVNRYGYNIKLIIFKNDSN